MNTYGFQFVIGRPYDVWSGADSRYHWRIRVYGCNGRAARNRIAVRVGRDDVNHVRAQWEDRDKGNVSSQNSLGTRDGIGLHRKAIDGPNDTEIASLRIANGDRNLTSGVARNCRGIRARDYRGRLTGGNPKAYCEEYNISWFHNYRFHFQRWRFNNSRFPSI